MLLSVGKYVVFAVVSFFVFDNNSFNVFFKFRNMAYYQSPQKFSFHAVITMNYAVACIDNLLSVWNLKCRVFLPYAVDCFTHYLCFALHNTSSHKVLFKQIKSVWKANKATLHFIDGIQNILKMLQNIFISHKSSVLYD